MIEETKLTGKGLQGITQRSKLQEAVHLGRVQWNESW
jgi:hypothetical protein